MAKVVARKKVTDRESVRLKTQTTNSSKPSPQDWWNADSKKECAQKLLSNVEWLKQENQFEYRKAAIFARLYGNLPLTGMTGSSLVSMHKGAYLPVDRPTRSVITSAIDTLVARLSMSRPRPRFLTENGDYRQRNLAKQVNQFIAGEFYQVEAYKLGPLALRDSGVLGTGVLKVLEDRQNKRVAVERRLRTEILVDQNDGYYGLPRMKYELKLVDREVLADTFPKYASLIERATAGFPDGSTDGGKTVADQVIVAEGFRLPSGPKSGDGLHVIACSEGIIFEEEWKKPKFPYVELHYSPNLVGAWGTGLAERQMGNQMGINGLLMTMHKSINLVGVPRVFVEDGSKVVSAHLNNDIGSIVKYRGTKPSYEVAPCYPVELGQRVDAMVMAIFQDEGISELAAQSQKPAGLDSGEAIRQYDDIQSARFTALQKRYTDMYIDLAYLVLDKAIDIAERDGSYQTVFPDKDGTREINLPEIAKLKDNPFVIQAFDESSLPKDPAARQARITEWVQAGLYTPTEGRRLMGNPDTEAEDKLLDAAEERILKQLDDIVESGKYSPPDPYTDLQCAKEKVGQYYNLYVAAGLEESKAEKLRNYDVQVDALMTAATPPPPPQMAGVTPQAAPMPTPQSPLIPNSAGAA